MADATTHQEFDPLATGGMRRRLVSKAIVYGALGILPTYSSNLSAQAQ